MISINNSDWLIPVTHFYFYIIYTWAHGSGMQIEDLAPFKNVTTWKSPLQHVLRIICVSPIGSYK